MLPLLTKCHLGVILFFSRLTHFDTIHDAYGPNRKKRKKVGWTPPHLDSMHSQNLNYIIISVAKKNPKWRDMCVGPTPTPTPICPLIKCSFRIIYLGHNIINKKIVTHYLNLLYCLPSNFCLLILKILIIWPFLIFLYL